MDTLPKTTNLNLYKERLEKLYNKQLEMFIEGYIMEIEKKINN